MDGIKRFFVDESGTAEATSTVIMIAAAGLLLAAGLYVWYNNLNTFFGSAGTKAAGAASNMKFVGP